MRLFTSLAIAAVLALAATPVSAATANFQGDCTDIGSIVRCTFDSLRPSSNPSSCPGSFPWKYSWDFNDGSTALTGNNQITHDYDDSTDYFPKLTVICWDGNTPNKTRHLCIHFGSPGCIQVGVGWN